MLTLKVIDEMSPLEAVVLGIPDDMGGTPALDDLYDPKSKQHLLAGTYPKEQDIKLEMDAFENVLLKYGVTVYRPVNLANCNQVFARDIGIVIGDSFVVPRILDNRKHEIDGIRYLIDQIPAQHKLDVPKEAWIEGGDIMPYKGTIFAGYSKKEDFDQYIVSRTNEAGIEFLKANFPKWNVIAFELKKSDTDPFENALHLDCCFQPVGQNAAILYPGGFKNAADVDFIINFFGKENIIEITRQEMYDMNSNIFSIRPDVVVSEKGFTRVNAAMRAKGIIVEEIPYSETAKMEGLLRCSTLPLRRKYE